MTEKGRILIVDDERYNIKVLTGILRDDYKIMAAKDGESALKNRQWTQPAGLDSAGHFNARHRWL